MCGIIGIISSKPVSKRLINSLQKLEYRGYDSAGIAAIANDESIEICKVSGRISELEKALEKCSIDGKIGIGHTRWATHGLPQQKNAHPFVCGEVAIVHNGIIENHNEIRAFLKEKINPVFSSDTDSEVIAVLINYYKTQGFSNLEAIQKTFIQIKGAFAIAAIFAKSDTIVGMRKGAPMAIGIGENEMFLGSDALALSDYTNKISYLNDGEYVVLTRDSFAVYNQDNQKVEKTIKEIDLSDQVANKGNYEHFMLKEIFEQPLIITNILNKYYDTNNNEFLFKKLGINLSKYKKIHIIACGSSYHAALVAKYWIERYAKIITEVEIASEFRYRSPILHEDSLAIVISQSGETADTLAALRYMKEKGLDSVAIVNVEESTIANEANFVLPIYAGFEIGVASTKAFIAQLLVLALITIDSAYENGYFSDTDIKSYLNALHNLPNLIEQILSNQDTFKDISSMLSSAKSILYTGRGATYPIALEGALKIKEISYIHAEGIAAGELKHGSIALIDEFIPVIALAPYNDLFAKNVSNIHEIHSRKCNVIALTEADGKSDLTDLASEIITIPSAQDLIRPILYTIPLQLIAYYTALHLNKDVDKPRNLAKSVTVE